jgi:hypothetical protein
MVEHANLHEEFHHHHHHHDQPQGYVYQAQPVAYVASPTVYAVPQGAVYAAPPVAYGAPAYGAPVYATAPPV